MISASASHRFFTVSKKTQPSTDSVFIVVNASFERDPTTSMSSIELGEGIRTVTNSPFVLIDADTSYADNGATQLEKSKIGRVLFSQRIYLCTVYVLISYPAC